MQVSISDPALTQALAKQVKLAFPAPAYVGVFFEPADMEEEQVMKFVVVVLCEIRFVSLATMCSERGCFCHDALRSRSRIDSNVLCDSLFRLCERLVSVAQRTLPILKLQSRLIPVCWKRDLSFLSRPPLQPPNHRPKPKLLQRPTLRLPQSKIQ